MIPLTPHRSRLILAGLFVVIVIGFRGANDIPPPARDPKWIGDANLQLRTIERIRNGTPFYTAVGDELRQHGYPTWPIFNWRTPLHYELVAAMSIGRASTVLSVLALAVVFTGALVYAQYSRIKSALATVLLLAGMAAALLVRPAAVGFPEHWAGILVGLSINAYLARLWVAGAALGTLALFFRELAAPYVVVCGLLALRAKRWRESLVWGVAALAYTVYFFLHAIAAIQAVHAGDLVREESYMYWQGPAFVFKTLFAYAGLTVAPPFLIPIAAALGLAGAWAPTAPPQLALSVVVYFFFFCIIGQPFNFYWGFLTCALWAHAFVHSIEGVRVLVDSASAQ